MKPVTKQVMKYYHVSKGGRIPHSLSIHNQNLIAITLAFNLFPGCPWANRGEVVYPLSEYQSYGPAMCEYDILETVCTKLLL